MKNWMDLNSDGKIDSLERMFVEETLCGSGKEHMALFGNLGDFDDDKADLEFDAAIAGLDVDELEIMSKEKRAAVMEEAGLDSDDYDFM